MQKKREHLARYIALGVFFVAVCLVFVGKLVNLQIAGQDYYTISGTGKTRTRTVKIQALRGQIYDTNGVPLVTNEYSYDINLDASSLPLANADKNECLLNILSKLGVGGYAFEIPECAFSLSFGEGLPVFSWNREYMLNEDGTYTTYGSRLVRLIDDITEKETAEGELPDADTSALLLMKRYGLTYKENKETYLTYESDADTEMLFRLRLDMELKNFSSLNPYLLVSGADLELITAVSEGSSRGISVKTNVSRVYNEPGYASHILGRVGKIQSADVEYYDSLGYEMDATVGVSGAEKAFEEYLRGVDGELTITEDSEGNVIDEYVSKEPQAGYDVYLTVDIELQKLAEDTFDANIAYIRYLAENNEGELDGEDAAAGAFCVMSVKDSSVLALVSNPTYDLSTFSEDYAGLSENKYAPLFNRALNGTYTPGSTFKPGVAVAALNEGTITPYTEISCEGVYNYYADVNFTPRCWINLMFGSSHGPLNVTGAIQVSCNCFFYEVGRRLTIDTMNRYCRAYGLGQPTGIELDESVGILAGPDYRAENGLGAWSPGDTVQAAIGQSDNMFSPLQICGYISTIVNGGTRYGAHILKEVRSHATGEVLYTQNAKEMNSIELSRESVNVVLNAMRNVTEDTGSAARLFSNYPLTIGGKTGTAQVGTNKSANAIFTAFAPFDSPEIVCATVIEQGAGGTDAGYAVRDIFTEYFDLEYADAYDEFRDGYLESRETHYAAALEE